MLAGDVFGADTQCVDVCARSVHAESIGAERVYLGANACGRCGGRVEGRGVVGGVVGAGEGL